MELAQKLQLKPNQTLTVLDPPHGFESPAPTATDVDDGRAVLAFVHTLADLPSAAAVVDAGREDRLAWLAYPKGGRLGTDLNRDRLVAALAPQGLQPVRQISIDDTWSALRFRPAELRPN